MSFLNIFKSKIPEQNYSVLNTDLHSHFIQGIDDGCKNLEESIELLKVMLLCGFRSVVCTPHVQFEYYRNTPDIILSSFDILQNKAMHEIPEITLYAAAEYLIDEGFHNQIQQGLLSFGKKKYVLVELSFFTPFPKYKNLLQEMLMKGYTPVLAHPERYGYWDVNDSSFEDLRLAGVEMQLNIPSLCGYYGSEIQKRAVSLIENGIITCLGTDVHNLNYMNVVQDGLKQKRLQKLLNDKSFINSTVFTNE
jgi:tyrosine-protein phosphatase YwqE